MVYSASKLTTTYDLAVSTHTICNLATKLVNQDPKLVNQDCIM